MSAGKPEYGQVRRARVMGALKQEVPPLNKTNETHFRLNSQLGLECEDSHEELLPGSNPRSIDVAATSTPYESIVLEESYLKGPVYPDSAVVNHWPGGSRWTPGSRTSASGTTLTSGHGPAAAGNWLGPMQLGNGGGGGGTSKRGRESSSKQNSQQGACSKRSKKSHATPTERVNNNRDNGVRREDGDEDGDEEDDDESDGDGDDGPGPKGSQPFQCPMPSCRDKKKQWDNWSNLIQHLQNTHIKGFSVCERGCGQRFGLSSQYTRHVFKKKKKCKPADGPIQRIPGVALDLNHAVGRIRNQDYEKLKRVIEQHNYYDLEVPDNVPLVEFHPRNPGTQNPHQYTQPGHPQHDWVEQIIKLLRENAYQPGFQNSQRVSQPLITPTRPPPQFNHSNISSVISRQPSAPTTHMSPSLPNLLDPSGTGSYGVGTFNFQPHLNRGESFPQPNGNTGFYMPGDDGTGPYFNSYNNAYQNHATPSQVPGFDHGPSAPGYLYGQPGYGEGGNVEEEL